MVRILRGDTVRADLEPTRGHEQAGQRPVSIPSDDVFNDRSGSVIAIALTRRPQKAGFPLALELLDTNLPKRSWAEVSQIRTLSVQRLKKSDKPRPGRWTGSSGV
jgi:mRNA interferase MazF